MATIKSYTDLEQSKRLATILPLESADMHYINDKHAGCVPYLEMKKDSNPWLKGVSVSPCWSLAALINVIPEVSLNTFKDRKWNAMVQHDGKMIYGDKDNPVDACVEMIERLHELNLL